MDPHLQLASRDDIWRLQNDMKNVYATQAEHADRLTRLERRHDDDGRVKSVWGSQSPFTSILNGTAQQGTLQRHYLYELMLMSMVQIKATIRPLKPLRILTRTTQPIFLEAYTWENRKTSQGVVPPEPIVFDSTTLLYVDISVIIRAHRPTFYPSEPAVGLAVIL